MAELERLYAFEDPWGETYKIYSDGSHYIARRRIQGKRVKTFNKPVKEIDRFFERVIFPEARQACSSVKKDGYRKAIEKYALEQLEIYYPYKLGLTDYVSDNVGRKLRNLWQREKRFRRKAYLNSWNYFVSFTYSDEKHTEESFVKKLRKCLSNLSTRRGWRFMGVSERGEETDRLHFHFLVYVPPGQMIGNISYRRKYSKRKHKLVDTFANDFFERKFGMCDFEELDRVEMRNGNTVSYLLKYLRKTDGRVIYSRGVPTEISKRLTKDEFAAELVGNFLPKFVIFDGVIDWERDVKPRTKLKTRMIA